MRRTFWNHQEARLRAGWRVLLIVVAVGVVSTMLSGPVRRLLTERLPYIYASLIESLALVVLVAVILWLREVADRRRFVDYGFHLGREWWLDMAFGLLLGLVLVGGGYAVLLGTGWLRIIETFVSPEGLPFIAAMLIDVLIVVGIAGWEEMVFRGYMVKNLAEGLSGGVLGTRWGTVVAVLVPAAFFGRLHASNPNATVLSVVNIADLRDPVRCRVRADRRAGSSARPAFRLGLHPGIRASARPDPSALGAFLLVEEGDAGARLWTGWPSGFEGGLVATGDVRPGLRADPRVGPVPARHRRGAAVRDTGTGARGGTVSGSLGVPRGWLQTPGPTDQRIK